MIPPRIFTGGAPHLISGVSAGPDIMARDHPNLSKVSVWCIGEYRVSGTSGKIPQKLTAWFEIFLQDT